MCASVDATRRDAGNTTAISPPRAYTDIDCAAVVLNLHYVPEREEDEVRAVSSFLVRRDVSFSRLGLATCFANVTRADITAGTGEYKRANGSVGQDVGVSRRSAAAVASRKVGASVRIRSTSFPSCRSRVQASSALASVRDDQ